MYYFNKTTIAILVLLLCSFTGDDFFSVDLKKINNESYSFRELKQNKATIIVFLLSDCPASQSYTLTLNNLSKNYASKNVSMIGVFPGKYSTDEELNAFKRDYKIQFPLLKDPEMILAKKLSANIAPSCFLIDDKGSIVYQGRIDDWLYAVGKKKPAVTKKDLEDAIVSMVNDKPIAVKETEAIGCILEYGQ